LSIANIDYLRALEFGANDRSAGLFDRQSKSGDQFGQIRARYCTNVIVLEFA
jgi:hypothetical protein